jgi:hypothetical protein
MLLAVLYSADEEVLAAGLACDQQPLGDRYWPDVLAIDMPAEFETAYMQIDDPDFANRVLDFTTQFDDGHAAAEAIDEYTSRRDSKIKKRRAA